MDVLRLSLLSSSTSSVAQQVPLAFISSHDAEIDTIQYMKNNTVLTKPTRDGIGETWRHERTVCNCERLAVPITIFKRNIQRNGVAYGEGVPIHGRKSSRNYDVVDRYYHTRNLPVSVI